EPHVRARDGEPDLAIPFRLRAAGHAQRFWHARGQAIASGAARLAGHRVRGAQMVDQVDTQADHDVRRLPARLERYRTGAAEGSGEHTALALQPAALAS